MSAIVPSRRFRALRALWRAFVALAESDAAKTFGRALDANLTPAIEMAWKIALGVGISYFVVRIIVSTRWSI